MPQESSILTKSPRVILEDLFAFSPNREILGGTAYFIVEKAGNILVDCPTWNEENQQFLLKKGGVRWLFLTHRGGIGKHVQQMRSVLECEVIIHEQEAYLLPEIPVTTFVKNFSLSDRLEAIWTPGHSPGSACLYWEAQEGVLFSGRHLLPNQQGKPMPLRTAKTFHWFRQLQSTEVLRDRFTSQTLHYICPGANTGFLRGKGAIEQAYQGLLDLDLSFLRQIQPIV
jgi:glyoxylase-like metal-dependent hydrolase (beta-lactamase superfamily II)